jgi:hypothetical protein
MRGVYVLDLESSKQFIISASHVQDAENSLMVLLKNYRLNYKFEGSYHYYPIHKDESEYEAEKRIYLIMAKHYGIQYLLARDSLLESIGKGTWTSEMPLKKMVRNNSDNSIGNYSEDKDVFSMSI